MECLVTMTTRVPEGTAQEAVDAIRSPSMPLTRHPSDPVASNAQ
jgi:hypothetical protein